MLVYKVAHCVAAQAGFSMHAACVVSVAWFVPAVPSVMASQPTALKITSIMMYVCALQAFTLVNPLFRITSDPTQIVQIDYRLRSDCLEHLKCRLWI